MQPVGQGQAPAPERLAGGGPGMAQRDPGPPRGCRIWTLSGVLALLLVTAPVTLLLFRVEAPGDGPIMALPQHISHVTITQPVTSLSVRSYGGDIRVIGASTSQVQVTESVSNDPQ